MCVVVVVVVGCVLVGGVASIGVMIGVVRYTVASFVGVIGISVLFP